MDFHCFEEDFKILPFIIPRKFQSFFKMAIAQNKSLKE